MSLNNEKNRKITKNMNFINFYNDSSNKITKYKKPKYI